MSVKLTVGRAVKWLDEEGAHQVGKVIYDGAYLADGMAIVQCCDGVYLVEICRLTPYVVPEEFK